MSYSILLYCLLSTCTIKELYCNRLTPYLRLLVSNDVKSKSEKRLNERLNETKDESIIKVNYEEPIFLTLQMIQNIKVPYLIQNTMETQYGD